MQPQTISNLKNLPLKHTTKAVVFDSFGTLMQIKDKQKPYKFLLEYLKTQDFKHTEISLWLMGNSLTLEDIEKEVGFILPIEIKMEFKKRLYHEVSSVQAFSETNEVIDNLQNKGIQTLMCSNLASPYGEVAKHSTQKLNHYVLSYEVGYIKPQAEIFKCCQSLTGLSKSEILFVGDNYKDDYCGALEYGFEAIWLKRDLHSGV